MKIIIVHNRYAIADRGSGEEVMVDAISNLLAVKGHTIIPFMRTSFDINKMIFGKLRAFFSGIYSRKSKMDFTEILIKENPDAVLVQNVFPLISPSILIACKELNIPVVMRCPNYRLICPTGLFMRNGEVCELCVNGHEYNCLLHNCENNFFKSTGYALRNYVARRSCFFKNNVNVFMVLTEFAKKKFIENGFPANKLFVLSGLANLDPIDPSLSVTDGKYIGFAGRISEEKGVDILIKSAKMLPDIPFKIAGKYEGFESMVKSSPDNVEFLGQLNNNELIQFYNHARIIVLPSRCYEGFPAVIIEAMLNAKPVIGSDLGGLPEIIIEGWTGFLFKHNDADDFSKKIETLWLDPALCKDFGEKGRDKAIQEYNPDAFYERLIHALNTALKSKSDK